jgi:hypothetical protein
VEEKVANTRNRAKKITADLAESFIPTKGSTRSAYKTINIISLVYALIFLVRLIYTVWHYRRYFGRSAFETALKLEPLLIMALATFSATRCD